MIKASKTFILIILCTVLVSSACVQHTANDKPQEYEVAETSIMTVPPIVYQSLITVKPVVAEKPIKEEDKISDEDVALIALVTMAEAEGECEEGKRLVISTILNRVDSEHFPDTVYDVIYQKYHFSSMWNGRVERCEVREDICQLVREEFESRTNYDVIFFTAGAYSKYGVPMFQVENHYFSSYY